MKHRKERFIYVGVDLHKRTHTAVVINCWNEKLAVIPFENKPAAFPAMVEQVVCHVGEGQTVVFGLEDVGGYGRALAAYLVENGFTVKEVNAALSNWKRKSYAMTESMTVGMRRISRSCCSMNSTDCRPPRRRMPTGY